MKRIIFLLLFSIFLVSPALVSAENNKFGIHIIDEHDLEDAAELVNSNGGEWGYVTIVIRDDQLNKDRWQNVFNQMRRLKLIPIIRIATHLEGPNWATPQGSDARKWAEFLHSLNWPVKERLVVLFNEPNHAKEWGGKVDPVGYANAIKSFESELRRLSDDFKVLPGALDLAAPNSSNTMEASRFFDIAQNSDTFLFTRFDYWNSHSYPNPGFSGNVTDEGQQSIRGYQWEIDHLSEFGLSPDIKVFITETGWISSENINEDKMAENYLQAFNNVWNDEKVIAVTPFILNYQESPFDKFSWRKKGSNEFYKVYDAVKSLQKEKGEPTQEHKYELVKFSLAKQLVAQSEYTFKVTLKNTGQSIWTPEDGFAMHFESTFDRGQVKVWNIPYTEPGQQADIFIQINTKETGKQTLTLQFNKDGELIGEQIVKEFEILSPPSMEVRVLGWFGYNETSSDYNLELFDEERRILNIDNLSVIKGIANVPSLYNVIPGNQYKIVIGRKLHASKTKLVDVDPIKTSIDFGRLLPEAELVDFITNPLETQKVISPF